MDQLPHDPVRLLVEELWWMLESQRVRDLDIAQRAFINRKTLSIFRNNVLRMREGALLPLPPWGIVIALMWAFRPSPGTYEYSYWMEHVTRLYQEALNEHPREYGATGSMRAIERRERESGRLPPLVHSPS